MPYTIWDVSHGGDHSVVLMEGSRVNRCYTCGTTTSIEEMQGIMDNRSPKDSYYPYRTKAGALLEITHFDLALSIFRRRCEFVESFIREMEEEFNEDYYEEVEA